MMRARRAIVAAHRPRRFARLAQIPHVRNDKQTGPAFSYPRTSNERDVAAVALEPHEMGEKTMRMRIIALAGVIACLLGTSGCGLDWSAGQPEGPALGAAWLQPDPGLVIETESVLPDTHPQVPYQFRFRAHGGMTPLHWKLEKGALPPGMKLQEDGFLHGQAERGGEFQFTLSVKEGGNPQSGVQKEFILRVLSALSLRWKDVAHVNGKRIEGSVNVSNTTPDDLDLTFIVLAVAGNGRATAIGYQHFPLKRGTIDMELPFGENLPPGGYVVNVDAVGEMGAKKLIYRERMQTPGPLRVVVGP